MKKTFEITNYLVSLGFLATEGGIFVRIEKGVPQVAFYDYNSEIWVIDTINHRGITNNLNRIKEIYL